MIDSISLDLPLMEEGEDLLCSLSQCEKVATELRLVLRDFAFRDHWLTPFLATLAGRVLSVEPVYNPDSTRETLSYFFRAMPLVRRFLRDKNIHISSGKSDESYDELDYD